jgi:hypothetical protein
LDVPKEKLGASLLNRYILIKDQGLLWQSPSPIPWPIQPLTPRKLQPFTPRVLYPLTPR